MSNIVFSRLVNPQFSFLFSNYNPANAKTTMKAQLKMQNLQLHPKNISFFLSAFGPFRLTSGTVSKLSIKKSVINSDTTPIRISCDQVVVNIDLITGEDIAMEYDLSSIPSLGFPADSIQSELDVSSIKVKSLKVNLNVANSYTVCLTFSNFVQYATNNNFLIDTSMALRQLISQTGFVYKEMKLTLDSFYIVEHKHNFDQFLGMVIESIPVTARTVVKKRMNLQFNQSEMDVFLHKDLTFNLSPELMEAITSIKQLVSDSYKGWDVTKRNLQVCNHLPSMLSFLSRITVTFKGSILIHVQIDSTIVVDLIVNSGTTFTSNNFSDCPSISKAFLTIPNIQLFINGEEFITAKDGGAMSLSIPTIDPTERSYLNPSNFSISIEDHMNSKAETNCSIFNVPGNILIDVTIADFENLKNKIKELSEKKLNGTQAKGKINNIKFVFMKDKVKNEVQMENVNFKLYMNEQKTVNLEMTSKDMCFKNVDNENEKIVIGELNGCGLFPFLFSFA
ncbi:hypothetical protein GPJ56_004905 [Histomonas meleagridis]|uniref:uncharacterized protein n=1 Tax=Histomonas meleagridis TaxID=135588 RepID=UPI003559818B|nr:hypothetical protein GPJ56_004905 [Histomonas meleagridis]KAH0806047.1 hypothetical protein GO595_001060 [Histomonas meleagridis]